MARPIKYTELIVFVSSLLCDMAHYHGSSHYMIGKLGS